MGALDDLQEVKKDLKEIKEESFAMEFVKDYKKQNKRLFVMWVITFIALLGLSIYTIYLLNDTSSTSDYETITVEDVQSIDNSHIKIGDDLWEKSH